MKKLNARVICAFLLTLTCLFAATSMILAVTPVTAKIPVTCSGVPCTAVLYDKTDTEVDRLDLQPGVTSYFEVDCPDVGDYTYTIKLDNADGGGVTYDKTEFETTIVVYYASPSATTLSYAITATPGGTLGEAGNTLGKPTELIFKNTRSSGPGSITITVEKVWVGEGPHPAEVSVELVRDGGLIVSTAKLNAGNGWQHAFTGLPSSYDYTVREVDVPEGYTASIVWSAYHCTVINTQDGTLPKPCFDDPPVRKIVEGSPDHDDLFTFVMTADDPSYPMPPGSADGKKETSILGEGEDEFGVIVFTAAGTYSYKVVERDTGADGCTYDKAIYEVSYHVTEKDGVLSSSRTIKRDGEVVTDFTAYTFTNAYDDEDPEGWDDSSGQSDPSTPLTGDETHLGLWQGAAIVSFCAAVVLGLLLILARRKAQADEQGE